MAASDKLKLDSFEISIKKDKGCSFVWQHFGRLQKKCDGSIENNGSTYCMPCFVQKKLKSYKDSVSTGNLAQHLRDAHGILFTQKRLMHICRSSSSPKFLSIIFVS